VYKAFDAKRKRLVAIEIPRTHLADPQRLIREARLVAELNHPNVVDILDIRMVNGIPCIVAEFVEGTSLRDHIRQYRDAAPQVVDLVKQIAEGLRAAHERGVVHRDLKPSNILITKDHQAKIVDFGLVHAAGMDGRTFQGTPAYMAPEQLRGESAGAAADIYSLGVVAYELFAGSNPFERSTRMAEIRAVLDESPAPPATAPEDAQVIITRMLSKDPWRRPTAQDVVRELTEVRPYVLHRVAPLASESFQVQFREPDAYYAALATESAVLPPTVASERRRFFSVDVTSLEGQRQLRDLEKHYGAVVIEDYQYDMDYRVFDQDAVLPELASPATLEDVLRRIRAREAWTSTRGQGVAIAIVDTGIESSRPEFAADRRVGAWQAQGEDAWTDSNGHGTMCASIALASSAEFTGVAPDAGIISCKVNFKDSQLTLAYDYLTDLARSGVRIVASNSWGTYTGSAPAPRVGALFPSALQDALDAGVIVVCSAGNYHDLTGGSAGSCDPTSIWLHKCRGDVLTVATCKLDGEMWFYSSRGFGQHFGDENMSSKPDVTAPTPENGLILYGKGTRILADGWGTSGAAPQVAGLAALLLAEAPGIGRAELFAIIRDTAEPLTSQPACCGSGMIQCQAALTLLSRQ
jgi:serine protease AprX